MKYSVMALALGSFVVFGCSGTYRVVKKTQAGGEVALVGPQESAREKANQYMASQCSQGFDIVEEGEAVVGSVTQSRGQAEGGRNIFGNKVVNSSGTSETTDKREWRIKYQCKGAASAPASGMREVIIYF